MKPSKAQLEIGLLAIGTLALIALYRVYLDRSLALQQQHYTDLLSRLPEPAATRNGHVHDPAGHDPATQVPLAARRAAWLHDHVGEPLPAELRENEGTDA